MNTSLSYDVAIIGAGPVGMFSVFELGLLGLNAVLIDNLDRLGGQCIELYPEKPIYDIPGYPIITGRELAERLLEQVKPFAPDFLLGRRVDVLKFDESTGAEQKKGFTLITSEGDEVKAKAVFIAAGAGSFTPRRPKVDGLDTFEGKSAFYSVKDKSIFAGKKVVILGGGDSALDWSLELVKDCSALTLVHRRKKFRAHPASVDAMWQKVEDGKMNFEEAELDSVRGEGGILSSVCVKNSVGEKTSIETDYLLGFFGLNIELGPIADWGMDLQDGKLIKVDTEKFETSVPGIFAVGDINSYPGKLKLILSGFHESALASQAAFKFIKPDEKLRFQYTTSSSELQKRLQVK